MGQQFGDTTLTKVFVGGLAWEMQKEALREHFDKYGEILEAVIISDKISGRSKGYGFVTFKEAEAAKKACEDATPVINGRRANCNLASLGAKRGGGVIRHSPPSTPAPLSSRGGQPPPPGMAVGSRVVSPAPPAAQWYYQNPSGTPPPPFQLHQYHHGLLPFYSTSSAYAYSPNYMADFGYNSKLSPTGGGGYYHGQFSYPAAAQGGGMVAAAVNGMLPMYPFFHFHPHQSQGMSLPATHFFPPSATAAIPTIISSAKPAAIPPATVCVAVEQVKGAN
ncbi:putative RNA-binding protein ARP1 isoform X1 [Curcuma longa]|uniref:putative RNA-binding protein ARP1 isoform X1 n=1 Tax=Curcuma longa TaxID=136217 RepID=UPI003D9E91E5